MREIKFRLWDQKRKVMSEPLVLNSSDREWRFPNGESLPRSLFGLDVARFDWMEFTGQKDAGNVEICEGDIISVDANAKFPVTLEEGSFGIRVNEMPAGTFLIEGFWHLSDMTHPSAPVCRVIGNIHQNPELMK